MDVPPFISLTKEEDIEEIAKKWASAISNKYAREDAEEAARIVLRSGIVTELPDLREADLGGRKRFSGLTRANFHAAICEGAPNIINVNKRAYKFLSTGRTRMELGQRGQKICQEATVRVFPYQSCRV